LDKKELVKNKNKKDYEDFINSLDKMPELVPNKELCDIAKEELKKLSEEGSYNKYQIGEEFKSKLSDQFSQKDTSLIAIEDLKKLEEIIPKIIINEGDLDKKGRYILTNKEYTYIRISQSMSEGDISIILIFTKENCLNNSETLDSQESNERIPNDSDKKKEDLSNKDNNSKPPQNEQNDIQKIADNDNKKVGKNQDNIKNNANKTDKNSTGQLNNKKNKDINHPLGNSNSSTSMNNIMNANKNVNEVYFFTTLYHYYSGNFKIDIYKVEKKDKLVQYNDFKFQQEEYKSNNNKYFIFYIKLQIPKRSSFQIFIQYNNYNNYYYSDYIQANSNLLGHIKLYYSYSNSIASQLNINNDNFLFSIEIYFYFIKLI